MGLALCIIMCVEKDTILCAKRIIAVDRTQLCFQFHSQQVL